MFQMKMTERGEGASLVFLQKIVEDGLVDSFVIWTSTNILQTSFIHVLYLQLKSCFYILPSCLHISCFGHTLTHQYLTQQAWILIPFI